MPEGLGSVVIWTTTPWTSPGNRHQSPKISHGLYKLTEPLQLGEDRRSADLADNEDVFKQARVTSYETGEVADILDAIECSH